MYIYAAAPVDRSGFWGALTGILKRKRRQRLSTVEDGIYLEDIDSDSMDPEELSQFFPSRYIYHIVIVKTFKGV